MSYLALEPEPHLVASECVSCGARYFDRRNACSACFADEFRQVDVPTSGEVRTFTIVHHAGKGIQVPFVAAVVSCDGTSVRGNLVNVPADPEHVRLGMKVELVIVPVGTDADGTEAVGFGFQPVDASVRNVGAPE